MQDKVRASLTGHSSPKRKEPLGRWIYKSGKCEVPGIIANPGPKELAMRYRPLARLLLAVAMLLAFSQLTNSQIPPGITAVHYALADGTRLTGYLSLPRGYQKGERYPAILLLHGWRGVSRQRPQGLAESYLKLKIHQKYLCQQYVVFSGEYYADYLGDSREFQSMAAALKTMATLPQVDPQRIAVVGASHGGYLALMCMLHPDIQPKPKIAVSICGVVDVAEWVVYLHTIKDKPGLLPGLRQFALIKIPLAFGWPPDKDPETRENFARISVLSYVKNLESPILVIHGDRDTVVPITQARMLREALRQEKKNYEFFEEHNGGHFIYINSNAVWEKINAFLKKYL
jgi:dipeptidyl aminopeptidase/acylaminoacyl peptidase